MKIRVREAPPEAEITRALKLVKGGWTEWQKFQMLGLNLLNSGKLLKGLSRGEE